MGFDWVLPAFFQTIVKAGGTISFVHDFELTHEIKKTVSYNILTMS